MPKATEDLWTKGLNAGRQRDYLTALKCFLEWESQGHHEAWLMIGRCHLALRNTAEAILAFLTHLERYPDDSQCYFHLGRAYLSTKQYKQAIEVLLQARQLGEKHPQLEVLLGYSFLKTRRADLARQTLELAVQQNPQHHGIYQLYLNSVLVYGISAFRKENFELARDAMEFLLKNQHREFIVRLYLGASYRELRDYNNAYQFYLQLHDEEPQDLSLILILWELAQKQGLWEDAHHWRTLLKKLNPKLILPNLDEFYHALSWSLYEKGKFQQAIFYALKALKKQKCPDMHYLVGISYAQLNNSTKAINHFRQSLKLQKQENVFIALIKTLWKSRLWKECRHEVQLMKKWFPYNTQLLYFKTLVDAKLNLEGINHVEALHKIIKQYSLDSHIATTLAEIYLKRFEYREASHWLTKALEIDPQDEEALNLYLSISGPPPTIQVLKLCYQSRSHHQQLNHVLAKQLISHGQAQEAQKLIVENLKHYPDSTQDWELLAECERILENYSTSYAIWVRQLRRDPENRKAILHVFYLLYKLKQDLRAEKFKIQAITRLKDYSLHYSFAKAYEKLGLFEKAINEYMEHLAIFPGHHQSTLDLNSLRQKINQKKKT